MLRECRESVKRQTLPAAEHRVYLDDFTERVGLVLNEMATATDCEWLHPLADDDLLLPDHLETHAGFYQDADVVYSYCRVEGRDWSPNAPFDAASLHIPAVASIRRSLWELVGGWGDETRAEDHVFWRKCVDAGGRFACVPRETWVYRFHGHNKSLLNAHQPFSPATAT